MANMDQSFLIELDSNASPTLLIKQLIERLNTFLIHKACKPMRLFDPIELSEEELGNQMSESVDTEELMQTLTIQRRLSKQFKWRRSKWSKYCPVSLKNGAIVDGRSEYAAA